MRVHSNSRVMAVDSRSDTGPAIARVLVLDSGTDSALASLLYDLDALVDSGAYHGPANHLEALKALRSAAYRGGGE